VHDSQGFEMFVKLFTVGMLGTNCYVVGDKGSGEAVVIDPGFDTESEAQRILDEAERNGLLIKYIINTHGHPDHNGGNIVLKDHTNAPILIHEADASMLNNPPADRTLREGDIIEVGDVKLKVMHTPGHSPGSIALLAGEYVFSGDTLFAGSIGRYDLPGASLDELVKSLKKLLTLPDRVRVCPGHGPVTNIGEERRSNPFLRNFDWVAFG
jgi:glyoxylase-like metal-dependent hydrolase (beta-lactamase superfamily II)